MEFLKASRRKNVFSEVLHVILNAALAAFVFALVATGSMWLAFVVVLVSKWRVFAVRPRYWWANVQANIVDLAVSLGVVALMYLAGTGANTVVIQAQIAITILYAVWLIVIKPRSGLRWVSAQAAASLFVGSWALFAFAHLTPLFVTVIGIYVVTYGATRHILSSYEEDRPTLVAMVFGLVMAELGWAISYWTVGYGVALLPDFKVAQGSIIITAIAFLAERFYALHASGRQVRAIEVIIPTVFVVLIVTALLVWFSSGTGII